MIRILRWLILTSVAVGALLAVVALLGAEFGEIHAKIIGTSFSVTGAGMLALASLSAWERSRLGPLPGIGAATTIAGVALLIVGIWLETESEAYWKTMGTLLVVATAVALVSLLSLGRLAHRYQWVVSGICPRRNPRRLRHRSNVGRSGGPVGMADVQCHLGAARLDHGGRARVTPDGPRAPYPPPGAWTRRRSPVLSAVW